tara:strand:+ start:10 stop:531 length:522 start_codon:yes stop_codon:yes gene_type:complete
MGHVGKTVTQNVVSGSEITDGTVATADLADDAVTSAKLGLTISSGTGTQDPTANNTVHDVVTGLTIPDNALIIIAFNLSAKSGNNGTPGSNANVWVQLTDSSGQGVGNDSLYLGSHSTNQNPRDGYRSTIGQVTYFNNTGSALTSHKIRVQQYADGTFNASVASVSYKIIGLG